MSKVDEYVKISSAMAEAQPKFSLGTDVFCFATVLGNLSFYGIFRDLTKEEALALAEWIKENWGESN